MCNKIYIEKLEAEKEALDIQKAEVHKMITDALNGGSFHSYKDTFNKHVASLLSIEKRFPKIIKEEGHIMKLEAESIENNRYVLELYKQLDSLTVRNENKRPWG